MPLISMNPLTKKPMVGGPLPPTGQLGALAGLRTSAPTTMARPPGLTSYGTNTGITGVPSMGGPIGVPAVGGAQTAQPPGGGLQTPGTSMGMTGKDVKKWRPDAQMWMTDTEYNTWLQSQPSGLAKLGTEGELKVGAQTQAGQLTAQTQAEAAAAAQAKAQSQYQQQLATLQAQQAQAGQMALQGLQGQQQTDLQTLIGGQATSLEELQARLSGESEAARWAQIQPYLPSRSGGGVPSIQTPGGGGGGEDLAAQQAVFGRAAERQAGLTQGAMRGLESALAQGGFTEAPAGGAEAALRAGIVGQGAGALSDLIREQSIQDLQRRQAVADRNLQAQLTQRGQDVTLQTAQMAQLPALLALARGGGLY